MWKLLLPILAILYVVWIIAVFTFFQMTRPVQTKEPGAERKVEEVGGSERKSEVKSTETKPKVQPEKKPIDKPLGAVYKYNGTGFLGAWKNAQTGEERFYDQTGKFYTNTQEIKEMQKPKAITATSTK